MLQASIFQQRTNLADVERKSFQTSLANAAWAKCQIPQDKKKALSSANKWELTLVFRNSPQTGLPW